ncbi:uncharacterized protein LOC122670017 [Telopea speciosissima]|uniref:uncharacterized protein LOC122670017 n=1 Tax=Telopea speciosissima TaxID=54955 RepID=UPI001CC4EE71|nr:uncharacterized protein LOC122670017 [Telopea speciosissima]
MPNKASTLAPSGNLMLRNVPPVKASSSVVQPEMENNTVKVLEKLKEFHGWADNSLTEDIVAAVNNNFDQASTPLKDMVTSSSSSEENKPVDLAELKAVIWGCLDDMKPEPMDGGVIFENKLSNGTMDIKLLSRPLMSLPAEPERKEDDVYLTHRKDAVRMKRNLMLRNVSPAKALSSVLQPEMDFPIPIDDNDSKRQPSDGNPSRTLDNKVVKENNTIKVLEKLKELYGGADNSLTEDIVAAVNNNFDQASNPMKGMVTSSSSSEEDKSVDLAELKAVIRGCLDDMKSELMSLPAEPVREEDDVYLTHRKDAIRVVRSASQYTLAAKNAFLRGDHFSAQQLSLKAQEEWRLAKQLNASAAEEILTITNRKNNIWKLDLHGLHACEAVHALQKHLQKIETQMPLNCAVPLKKVKPKVGIVCPPLVETHSCKGMELKADVQNYTLSSRRWAILEVITGKGNHSRRKPVLPSTIRSFLLENGCIGECILTIDFPTHEFHCLADIVLR